MSIRIDYVIKRLFNFECNVPQPGASEQKIEQVEKEFGITFPNDYKKFLLYTNGGNFFETEEFFGILTKSDQSVTSVHDATQEFSEVLKKVNLSNSVPIHNGLGFHLLSNRKVYEVDIETGNVHVVADTFTDFLNEIIEEYKYHYPEIKPTIPENERKLRLNRAIEKAIRDLRKKSD